VQESRRDDREDARYDQRCYDDRYESQRRRIEDRYLSDRRRLEDHYYDQLRRIDRRGDRRDVRALERRRFVALRQLEERRRDDLDRLARKQRNDCSSSIYSDVNDRRGNGPPFCRNGQGHPVHGMQWCRDKGWSDGHSLSNTGWEDVILRRPRYDAQGVLGRGVLEDVLGRVVLGRFDEQRDRLGINDALTGRWSDSSNGWLLDLFAGSQQIGQILDRNRDGRADAVLLLR
jgi:hypothetical protein